MAHRHPLLGLGAALASSAAFATSGAFAKSLLIGGWAPGAVVTLRITIAAVVLLLPTLWVLRGRWGVLRRSARLVIGYGLTGVAGCQLAYFYAVSHLSVGVALLLEYLAPVLIVGWFWLRHRQKPRRLTVAGVILAMAGLMLVLDVLGGTRLSVAGVLWGLTRRGPARPLLPHHSRGRRGASADRPRRARGSPSAPSVLGRGADGRARHDAWSVDRRRRVRVGAVVGADPASSRSSRRPSPMLPASQRSGCWGRRWRRSSPSPRCSSPCCSPGWSSPSCRRPSSSSEACSSSPVSSRSARTRREDRPTRIRSLSAWVRPTRRTTPPSCSRRERSTGSGPPRPLTSLAARTFASAGAAFGMAGPQRAGSGRLCGSELSGIRHHRFRASHGHR